MLWGKEGLPVKLEIAVKPLWSINHCPLYPKWGSQLSVELFLLVCTPSLLVPALSLICAVPGGLHILYTKLIIVELSCSHRIQWLWLWCAPCTICGHVIFPPWSPHLLIMLHLPQSLLLLLHFPIGFPELLNCHSHVFDLFSNEQSVLRIYSKGLARKGRWCMIKKEHNNSQFYIFSLERSQRFHHFPTSCQAVHSAHNRSINLNM